MKQSVLRFRIKYLLIGFVIGLVLSGLTAFPLKWEVNTFARVLGATPGMTPESTSGLLHWILIVRNGLNDTYAQYPFIAYGTDWLAFGHLMIALSFLGPIRDPVKNIWVIEFGMLACAFIIPLALICGPIRGIPIYWRMIDCSFGVVGIVPLWVARQYTIQLQNLK